jgi:hypothetical protein
MGYVRGNNLACQAQYFQGIGFLSHALFVLSYS